MTLQRDTLAIDDCVLGPSLDGNPGTSHQDCVTEDTPSLQAGTLVPGLFFLGGRSFFHLGRSFFHF